MISLKEGSTFLGGWVGGWVAAKIEIKANSASIGVEIEF